MIADAFSSLSIVSRRPNRRPAHFRHTLSRTLRRAGIHPVVVRYTLHQSKVDLAMNVYDKSSSEDIRAGLRVVSEKLLGSDLLPKNLLPATPKPNEGGEDAA